MYLAIYFQFFINRLPLLAFKVETGYVVPARIRQKCTMGMNAAIHEVEDALDGGRATGAPTGATSAMHALVDEDKVDACAHQLCALDVFHHPEE